MVFCFEDYELDTESLVLWRGGKAVPADALVLRLLCCLVRHAGRLVTKSELTAEVWEGRVVADNAITVSMARLRKLLGQHRGANELVVTTYGRGYRFVPEVVVRQTPSHVPAAAGGTRGRTEPPFVGREAILEQLRRALDDARAARGRCCLLMGEPGIGKTSAVEEFTRELGAETRVAWGFCREAGDTPPLGPWLRLLGELVSVRGLNGSVTTGSFSEPLERALGVLAPEVRRLLGLPVATDKASVAPGQPAWQGPTRHRTFDTILRTLQLAAEQRPLVLVIDDLHRADAASLELLHHLLDEISHTRILLVATLRHARARHMQRTGTHLTQVLGHRNSERITLQRLGEADVSLYVSALIEDEAGTLGRAVFAKSEGNPFYMAELIRALRDQARPDPTLLAVSDAALDLLGQRLARLDPEVQRVLGVSAVLGRSFELPLLAAVTGDDPSQLMAQLDEALEAEVVVAAADSTTAFAFAHELLRAVLYDGLAPSERRKLHARVAATLERRADAGDVIPPSELAYHAYSALPEGDYRKTVQACRAAALAAAAVFANADVVRYTRHALEALDLIERPSIRLRTNLQYMIGIYGRSAFAAESAAAVREVVRLAREQRDGEMLVRAATLLNLYPGLPPLPGAAEACKEALEILPETALALRAVALGALAIAPPAAFDASLGQALLAQALPLARSAGSRATLYAVLVCKLYLEGGPDHADTIGATFDELEQLARNHPRVAPALPIDLAFARAISSLRRGDGVTAAGAIERASLRCTLLHHTEALWHCRRHQAWAQVNAGDWTVGLPLMEALHRQSDLTPFRTSGVFTAFDRVMIASERGELVTLDDASRSVLRHEPSDPPNIWALKLRALASSATRDEALAMLRAVAPQDLARLPCDRDYLGTLGHVTRAALLLGASEYLDPLSELLSRHRGLFAIGIGFACEGAIDQLLGMIACARGAHGQAATLLETGQQLARTHGFQLRAHEAQLQLTRLGDSPHSPQPLRMVDS